MPINRENVPEEFADALLGEADCFVSLPEVKELILPSGIAWSTPDAEFTYLKGMLLGDDFEAIPMVAPPLSVAGAPAVPDVEEFDQSTKLTKGAKRRSAHIPAGDGVGIGARDALRRASAVGCLTKDELRALEIHAIDRTDLPVGQEDLRVSKITGNESQGFKIQFVSV